jgi:membrane-bound inhibitor of C-type lysozyme
LFCQPEILSPSTTTTASKSQKHRRQTNKASRNSTRYRSEQETCEVGQAVVSGQPISSFVIDDAQLSTQTPVADSVLNSHVLFVCCFVERTVIVLMCRN